MSPQSDVDKPTNATPNPGTPNPEIEHAYEYSDRAGRGVIRPVDAAHQWLHATTGRIATCPHSWLTAVHWITDLAKRGLYTPAQAQSPKWGTTTVAVAQEIAALKECRPGIAYLMRKLKASKRTIQYHLTMLRETGLLAYRSKGTRTRGSQPQASVYERTIPACFDTEHGIRTTGEGVQRRPIGIAEHARKAIGKLAKKAARKTRRTTPRRTPRTPVSDRRRCTPMEGGTTGTSSADRTYSPPENELASGAAKSPHQKQAKRGPRTLNKIGRRYQLARELIQLVPWMRGASTPRIAWIVRHVADAGWTALEVQAIAEQERPILADQVRRPSGLLADRLGNLHLLFTTPERRRTAVLAWQESRIQEKARHADAAGYGARHGGGPQTPAARRAMDAALTAIRDHLTPDLAPVEPSDLVPLALEDLTREQVIDLRVEAMKNPDMILTTLEELGERDTRRLYTNRLVDQTLALENIAARNDTFAPAF